MVFKLECSTEVMSTCIGVHWVGCEISAYIIRYANKIIIKMVPKSWPPPPFKFGPLGTSERGSVLQCKPSGFRSCRAAVMVRGRRSVGWRLDAGGEVALWPSPQESFLFGVKPGCWPQPPRAPLDNEHWQNLFLPVSPSRKKDPLFSSKIQKPAVA